MAGGEKSISYHLSDNVRQLENAKSIRNCGPVFSNQICNALLIVPEFSNQPIVTFGLLHWIQIASLKVFDESHPQELSVVEDSHHGGDG
jgi:hypothetical protein